MKQPAPLLTRAILAGSMLAYTGPGQTPPAAATPTPRVVTIPVEDADSIAVTLGVRAGVFDELAGWNGAAHLVEHLVLNSPAGETDDPFAVLSAGGPLGQPFADCNAETLWQGTYFYALRPAPRAADDAATLDTTDLERTLGVFAAMLHRSTFDASTLATERPRAMAEVRNVAANLADNPRLRWMLERQARMPKAGTEAEMAALTLTELVAFQRAHYRPERCVLVIAGPIDEHRVVALVERVFAHAAGQAAASPDASQDAPQMTAKAAVDDRGAAIRTVPAPVGDDSAVAALLAAEVCAQRLREAVKTLRPEGSDAPPREANVWIETPADGSLRIAVALRTSAAEDHAPDAATVAAHAGLFAAALTSAMRSLANQPPDEAELRSARRTVTMPLRMRLQSSRIPRLPAGEAGRRALLQASIDRVLAELAGGRELLRAVEQIDVDAVRAAAHRLADSVGGD